MNNFRSNYGLSKLLLYCFYNKNYCNRNPGTFMYHVYSNLIELFIKLIHVAQSHRIWQFYYGMFSLNYILLLIYCFIMILPEVEH